MENYIPGRSLHKGGLTRAPGSILKTVRKQTWIHQYIKSIKWRPQVVCVVDITSGVVACGSPVRGCCSHMLGLSVWHLVFRPIRINFINTSVVCLEERLVSELADVFQREGFHKSPEKLWFAVEIAIHRQVVFVVIKNDIPATLPPSLIPDLRAVSGTP